MRHLCSLACFLFFFWGSTALAQVTYDVIAQGRFSGTWVYQELRLKSPGKRDTYAIWFPPGQTRPERATVVINNPYSGVEWAGESVDTYFAQVSQRTGPLMLPDLFGPLLGRVTNIFYDYDTPDKSGGLALPYLVNGLGVLQLYQRFYAGGDLQNESDDTALGFEFLQTQPTVDPTRVGIYGFSWGGFEAVYGAANAPAMLSPSFGVAWSAPVNFPKWEEYISALPSLIKDPTQTQTWLDAFDPYRRRTKVTHGGDYSAFTPAGISAIQRTHFLLLHDAFDTLVPISQVLDLYNSKPQNFELLLFPHAKHTWDPNSLALDHAPLKGFEVWANLAWTENYLLTRLSSARDWIAIPVQFQNLEAQLAYFKGEEAAGSDIAWTLVPRLMELCDPRVVLLDYNLQNQVLGTVYVTAALKKYWGIQTTPQAVLERLRTTGLKP